MKNKTLIEELIEDTELDKKIVKSFKIKDTLSNAVFQKKGKNDFIMKNDVREKLLEITKNFMDFLGVDFFIHDVVLTGSLSNYNWSEYSDVDLHIIIDYDETNINLKLLTEFFNSKRSLWNKNHTISIKKFDCEIYVQDLKEKHLSSGVYSILNNEWIIKPEKTTQNIDENKILEKTEEYSKKINNLATKLKNKENIDKDLLDLKRKIKRFRQSCLDTGGEYSYENLTFKMLRRNSSIKMLLDLQTTNTNNKLSITQ